VVIAFFRHGSNTLLVLGALVLSGLAIAHVPGSYSLWAIALGALLFFLSEYNMHRFALHARPASSPFVLGLQRRLHYDHHVTPDRMDLLFLPPWFLIPAEAISVGIYWLIFHDAGTVLGLLLGNFIGLLYYEWVHYVAHTPFRPVTPIGRYMKKYHLWHHFKNEKMWFGVTNPSLDLVYRTYAGVSTVERSETTRTLFR
jgi:sterol desaturase/sphingolipid hydroxylase (fatty acid hydroxylase superfamily)